MCAYVCAAGVTHTPANTHIRTHTHTRARARAPSQICPHAISLSVVRLLWVCRSVTENIGPISRGLAGRVGVCTLRWRLDMRVESTSIGFGVE